MFFLSFILFICLAAFVLPKIYKTITYWNKISNKIENFNLDPSDEAVYAIMDNVNKLGQIPNGPTYWDSMRAAYRLVSENENISDKCKREFRTFLLSKGVNIR